MKILDARDQSLYIFPNKEEKYKMEKNDVFLHHTTRQARQT